MGDPIFVEGAYCLLILFSVSMVLLVSMRTFTFQHPSMLYVFGVVMGVCFVLNFNDVCYLSFTSRSEYMKFYYKGKPDC